ncbi:MAG: pyridoxal-phosphate dependent enzyme [Micromonosporaceae bacterium]|nr:pyridoxal-phosphate dependent enzyme [Micromonosporaceae bacterium]
MITRADVDAATRRIAGLVRRTPVAQVEADLFSPEGSAPPGELWLKLEHLQHTGSFKTRGATNRILAAAESGELSKEAGVVAASGGNAGLAVAHVAKRLGIPAEVHVPEHAPPVKVAKLRALGAAVRQGGSQYAEAYDSAVKRAADTGALFCHAYDQPEICAGQGSVGLELAEQIPNLDTVLVAVGGGGLMAGVATALAGQARVTAVEPETIPTLRAALDAGRPVDIEVSGIAADSLGARRIGEIAYQVAVREDVGSVLVSDEAIIRARRLLWQRCRIAVEHGTAAALAALIAGAYLPAEGQRAAVLLCGANTDPSDLAG